MKREFKSIDHFLDQIVLLAQGRGRNRDFATLESIELAVDRFRLQIGVERLVDVIGPVLDEVLDRCDMDATSERLGASVNAVNILCGREISE